MVTTTLRENRNDDKRYLRTAAMRGSHTDIRRWTRDRHALTHRRRHRPSANIISAATPKRLGVPTPDTRLIFARAPVTTTRQPDQHTDLVSQHEHRPRADRLQIGRETVTITTIHREIPEGEE
ncbi:hypothetical protein [Actinoalloteichus spitiensis]|uniref:hypothetical protein n=1 Tax=Actinoalloteichus spitiensis TaxID=252394 RepID=UPI0012F670F4|nr:hypothetical protein [Actinoalloteichus spitiensis]